MDNPSPAIAAYGQHKTSSNGEEKYGCEARYYVEMNFYVDDGLVSLTTPVEVIDQLTRTKVMLSTANLCLHKIASNSMEVMAHFPDSEHAKDLCDLDLDLDALPVQQSL